MNKTITINLAGIVFHIDENAYEQLKNYLISLKTHFSKEEGAEEIIADIESRIAEMFQSRLNDDKQVITSTDILEIIAIMGTPESFEEHAYADQSKTGKIEMDFVETKKRLFRNPDDKVFGGVCSGISNYFNIDPLWLRLAFVLVGFYLGTGLFLYLILWIVLPEAKTTAQKLQMKGEPVNVENIEKAIREELTGVKERFAKFGKEAQEAGKNSAHGIRGLTETILNFIAEIFKMVYKVLRKVFGVFAVGFGFFVLFFLIAVVFGKTTFNDVDIPNLISSIFPTEFLKNLSLTAIFLLIGIPAFGLLYKGASILFNVNVKSRILSISLLTCWLIGLGIGLYSASIVAEQFKERAKSTETIVLPLKSNHLILNANDSTSTYVYGVILNRGNFVFSNHQKINLGVTFDIKKSENGKVELLKVQSANGKTEEEATQNASGINYSFNLTDSVLTLNHRFQLAGKPKLRGQEVHLVLKIPVGTKVYLSESLNEMIDDIKNVNEFYDSEMLNHTWQMTESGLRCLDCPEKPYFNYHEHQDQDEN